MRKFLLSLSILCFAAMASQPVFAKENAAAEEYVLILKNHKFEPAELVLPAGKKVKVVVKNQDPTPAEFESHDLKREKIIGGNKEAIINIGPLKPGRYEFFDEFKMDTTRGFVVVK